MKHVELKDLAGVAYEAVLPIVDIRSMSVFWKLNDKKWRRRHNIDD